MTKFEELIAGRISGTIHGHYPPNDPEAIVAALFEWADMEPLDIKFLAELLAALNQTEVNDLAASNPEPSKDTANPPLSAPTNTDKLDTKQLISRILWAVYQAGQYDAKKLRSSNVPVQGATEEIAHLIVQKQIEELASLEKTGLTDRVGIYAYQVDKTYMDNRKAELEAQLKGDK